MSRKVRGWTFPIGSRKAHYFLDPDVRSLCGSWMIVRPDPDRFEDERDDHSDNCASCRRKLAKIRAEKP